MNLDDLIFLFSNIPADFDGKYGVQCMDLMHFYNFIVLGIHDKTVMAAPTAADVWKLDYPKLFKKITNDYNDTSLMPVKGDILVFGTGVGPAGHICIVTSATGMKFTSFDANWPTGSYPKLVTHNYKGVLGWFHPLVQPADWKAKYDSLTKDHEIALAHIKNFIDATKQIKDIASKALE